MSHFSKCESCGTFIQIPRSKFIEWFYTDEEGGFIELLTWMFKGTIWVALIIFSVSEISYRTALALSKDEVFINSIKQSFCTL